MWTAGRLLLLGDFELLQTGADGLDGVALLVAGVEGFAFPVPGVGEGGGFVEEDHSSLSWS